MNNTTILNSKNELPVLKIAAISDAEIIAGIHENNLLAWEHLYNKYAGIMYAAILRLTDDTIIAENILERSFILLNSNKKIFIATSILSVTLLHHVHRTATNYLVQKRKAIKKPAYINEEFPVIKCLLYQPHSGATAAIAFGMPQKKLRQKLHAEFTEMRNRQLQNYL